MKKLALVLVLLAGSFFSGCASTLVETAPEHRARIKMQWDLERKMLAEDWDYIWLVERNSRLTQWHPYAGY